METSFYYSTPRRKSVVTLKKLAIITIAVAVGSVFDSSHFAIADWLIPVLLLSSI